MDNTKCMTCHREFTPEDQIVSCSLCGTYYHTGCWASKECINPECPSNASEKVKKQGQQNTKSAGLSAVGNPTCPICSTAISNMLEATYCPKCKEYHHSYCFERVCKGDRSKNGGLELKTKTSTKDEGVDEPSAEGNPKCSVCHNTIESMTDASYCSKCKAYHHNSCAKKAYCTRIPTTPRTVKRAPVRSSAPVKTNENKGNTSIAVQSMIFGLIALAMAGLCASPMFFACLPIAIVFACISKSRGRAFLATSGGEKNGFITAGNVTSTVAIPLSIVFSVNVMAYGIAMLILDYGEVLFEALDLDSLF